MRSPSVESAATGLIRPARSDLVQQAGQGDAARFEEGGPARGGRGVRVADHARRTELGAVEERVPGPGAHELGGRFADETGLERRGRATSRARPRGRPSRRPARTGHGRTSGASSQ